ncbi:MAG: site-specific DNA-methyltransferase [Planctomycetes bacterium]|nr:site-specific DNA-methyltransferase [Planctomycetota bacterium]MCW8137051.1 site-specific DNA-methyltransferase [Planctomycetota bacterium]
MNRVIHGDNLEVLRRLPDGFARLIYIDPPFNTGREQKRRVLKTVRDQGGDRTGFKGERYATVELAQRAYDDAFEDYQSFLRPRLEQAHRVLAADGSLYFHIDYREAHYCKVFLLDAIFGRDSFVNEIVWAYDYGGRPKSRWPAKHDTIFLYARDPGNYVFNTAEVEREPYMAPGLVGPEKAARGKLPTDVWWHTIVPTTSREKTGYPTQKPLGILKRMIAASSQPGDMVLDFFAGSGTTGAACLKLGRRFTLVDNNPQAIEVMRARLAENARFER